MHLPLASYVQFTFSKTHSCRSYINSYTPMQRVYPVFDPVPQLVNERHLSLVLIMWIFD